MAGPSLSILTSTADCIAGRAALDALLVDIGATRIDSDGSFYVGAEDPRPFVIGYQSAALEPEELQTEQVQAVLRQKLGNLPSEVLSLAAMCNQSVDRFHLAQIAAAVATRLRGVICFELFAPLPKDVDRCGWSLFVGHVHCTEPITYELYLYVVDPSVMRAWSLHRDFHLVK